MYDGLDTTPDDGLGGCRGIMFALLFMAVAVTLIAVVAVALP